MHAQEAWRGEVDDEDRSGGRAGGGGSACISGLGRSVAYPRRLGNDADAHAADHRRAAKAPPGNLPSFRRELRRRGRPLPRHHAADPGARHQRARDRGLRARGAGARRRQRAPRRAHDRRRVPGWRARLCERHLCRAEGQPGSQGRGPEGQEHRHQRDRLVRQFGDAHRDAPPRSRRPRLHLGRDQFLEHAGDARRRQGRPDQPSAAVPLHAQPG